MFEWFQTVSVVPLALVIFCLRICDVSLGTIRTITVVEGRVRLSVVLGFFEVLIWITAVSQVIQRIDESPVLLLAYASGFAAGNGVGILLERRIAMGACVVRFISVARGDELADGLRQRGFAVTTFTGHGRDGERQLVYVIVPRTQVQGLLDAGRAIDPGVFYVVERVSELGHLEGAAAAQIGLARKRL